MTEQLAKQVSDLILMGINSFDDFGGSSEVTPAFFDELRILHARSSQLFPREFNDLMSTAIFQGGSKDLMFLQRLNRVLHVINNLPPELRVIADPTEVMSGNLIPLFEIKKTDKDRIFELCSDMRKIVFSTTIFDEPHRLRLLNRIAAMEAETHKPKGMFDVMRGGMDDLGETLHKFGTNLEPLVKRMQEVVGLARKGTKEYDQLPAPEEVKKLPPPTDDDTV